MSTDFKIEIFACFTFFKSWADRGILVTDVNLLEYYRDEIFKDTSYLEVCDIRFILEIHSRLILFPKIYLREYNLEEAINWRSLSDYLDHVTRVCDRDDLFGHLNIFERMLATCAYVQNLCLHVRFRSFINVVNYGHIIWAMYFDKFTEQFYNEGGWNELKRVANGCGSVFDVLEFIRFGTNTATYLHITKEASLNYCQFQQAVKYDNFKCEHKGRIHVCKQWVKFHIEHFEEYVRIPLSYKDTADCIEMELLLRHLKLICTFLEGGCDDAEILQDELHGKSCSTGMLFSKTSDSNEKIITREDLRLENLRISETACNEFVDGTKCLETQLQDKCLAEREKIIAYEILEKTENGKMNSEMEKPGNKSSGYMDINSPKGCKVVPDETTSPRFSTNTETSDKVDDLDLNYKIDNENEKDTDYTSSLRKNNRQYKLLHAGNAPYSNQKDEIQWNKMSPPKDIPNPINLYSGNKVSKSSNEKESSKSSLKSGFYTENEERNGNTEQSCAFSSNQIAVSQCERNAIPNQMSTPKDFLTVKEVTHNEDGRINPNRQLDNLRKEQTDPDIRNFLRMILVLGDSQGIQYVCGTSRNSEEHRDASQVKPKKRNKKSKKKPRKSCL